MLSVWAVVVLEAAVVELPLEPLEVEVVLAVAESATHGFLELLN